MRIIGGKFKGRSLKHPDIERVRATAQKVREAVFSIMQTKLEGSRFLDGFAGTGAVGIEAFSRGASEVTFIEPVPKVLGQNLAGFEGEFHVLRAPFDIGIKRVRGQFDIIYMDPPWQQTSLFESGLRGISKFDILAPCGWVVCEHHKKFTLTFPEKFTIRSVHLYGDVQLSILQ